MTPLSRWIGRSALALGLMLSGCATSPGSARRETESREAARVEQRLNEVFEAAGQKDFARLDSYHLYGPKFTKWGAESLVRQDAESARNGEHHGLQGLEQLRMQADDLKIDVFGDLAIATFTMRYSFMTGTNAVAKRAHATLVFAKGQGSWKITHEHFSPAPELRPDAPP